MKSLESVKESRHESSLPNKLVGCIKILMAVTTPDWVGNSRHESSLPNKLVGCIKILMAVTTPDLHTEKQRPPLIFLAYSNFLFSSFSLCSQNHFNP